MKTSAKPVWRWMRAILAPCAVLCGLLTVVIGATGCGPRCEQSDVFVIGEPANIDVSYLGFTRTELGGEQVREIRFESLGPGTLRVTTVQLVEEDGDGRQELFPVDWDGERWDGPVFSLEPGESAALEVAYRPQNQSEDRGHVEVLTNDSDQREIRVELRPPAPAPELFVRPTTLTWRNVAPATDPDYRGEPRTLQIQNPGTAPLDISEIRVEGDDAFEWSLQQCTLAPDGAQTCSPEADIYELPAPIAPGESAFLRVWYRPTDRLGDRATLLVESDGSTVEVSLDGS